jgi:ABC-type uncharacterized transport system involved in gliding motility auxiliary subunit
VAFLMFRRRLLLSVNLLLTLGLLGVLFIMVNYLASRRYARWDLTRQQLTALSDLTRQTLRGLTEPLTIVVFYEPTHPLYPFVRGLLEEYERLSPRVQLEYVDPHQDFARAQQLVQEFEIDVNDPDALNLVTFKSGTRRKYLSDTDLAEFDYRAITAQGEPRLQAFKGEEAFTSAIVSVTQASQPIVWLTSGHGEKSIEVSEPTGLSELKKYLEQQNMQVEQVTLLERPAIAAEVNLVIIAGPTRRFAEHELQLLQSYLEQGGRLLALVDPLTDTALEEVLLRWGIQLGRDVVVDPARQLPFISAANLLVTTYTRHPIVEKMQTLVTLFPLARSARPAEPLPEGVAATPLAMTSPDGWGEINTQVETFAFTEGEDLAGPVPIAVAADRPLVLPILKDDGAPQTRTRTRLVAVGDSDFIVNAQLGNVGNRDLLLGSTYWLIEEEQRIGIGPKVLQSIRLSLTAQQLRGIRWFSLLGMPLLCGLLGVGMWCLRRK